MDIKQFRLKLYPNNFDLVRNFYENVLGFNAVKDWDRGNDDKGVMFDVGGAILELLSRKEKNRSAVGSDISLWVEDVHTLWDAMKDSQKIIFPLRDNEWGDTSFCISDPEGFEITFFTKGSVES